MLSWIILHWKAQVSHIGTGSCPAMPIPIYIPAYGLRKQWRLPQNHGHVQPYYRLRGSSWLMALNLLSYGHCKHSRNEPADGRPLSWCFLLSANLPPTSNNILHKRSKAGRCTLLAADRTFLGMHTFHVARPIFQTRFWYQHLIPDSMHYGWPRVLFNILGNLPQIWVHRCNSPRCFFRL